MEMAAFLARGESASGGEGDRVVDGAPAAEFLRRVKDYMEHPYLPLAEE